MRSTNQKSLVFDIINNSYSHLTARETYEIARKSITNISLGTVYRILNTLADDNKIIRIMTKSGIDHFDRIGKNRHSHFVCNNCQKITDLFRPTYSYETSELKGYKIMDIELVLTGICNECVKGKK